MLMQEPITVDRHLHTAGFNVDMCLFLLVDGFQLSLQHERNNEACHNTDSQRNCQIFNKVEGETVQVTVEIILTLVDKRIKGRCIIAGG